VIVLRRCPQCESLECGVWVCRFSGIPNKDFAATQEKVKATQSSHPGAVPAIAAPVDGLVELHTRAALRLLQAKPLWWLPETQS
jgi:hypothetical protein